MTNLTKPLLLLCIFTAISCAPKKNELYDSGTSSIINLNPMNFATQITNNRAKNVISFVHFYKLDDGKSKDYAKVITDLDKEYEGMFKIAGINCKEYRDLCEKQDVKEFPSFMIYPPLPAPAMKYEGKITVNHIISYLGKFVENKSTELNNNNFDNFISSNPNLPKILLFTDKKNVPLLFKRLSSHFNVRYIHIYIHMLYRKKLNLVL